MAINTLSPPPRPETFQFVGSTIRPPAVDRTRDETVAVPVAAKDLAVGTVLNADEGLWVVKVVRQDALPAGTVVNAADLADKRLSRPMRAGEAFVAADLNRGLTLPNGTDLVALVIDTRAMRGSLVPGARVDVVATLRDSHPKVFLLLEDVLVVNTNLDLGADEATRVGFALAEKQTLAAEMARTRGYDLAMKLRGEKPDDSYDLDAVLKRLEDGPLPVAPPPRPAVSPR